jgi:hypothetical protein
MAAPASAGEADAVPFRDNSQALPAQEAIAKSRE